MITPDVETGNRPPDNGENLFILFEQTGDNILGALWPHTFTLDTPDTIIGEGEVIVGRGLTLDEEQKVMEEDRARLARFGQQGFFDAMLHP
jgi:hypothetical protein